MERIVTKNNCMGCYACANACPKDAIIIKQNNYVSNIATVDNSKCVDCHICERVCPAMNVVEVKKADFCYAAWSKNDDDLKKSSSGGIAAVLSRAFLLDKGIVYGSVSKNQKVFHDRVDVLSKCDDLRGSKYVESSIGFCYRNVKKDLLNNKKVLFIGTPCQVAGLNSFLGAKYDNLLTVDLICHGTPLFNYLEEYIHAILPKKVRNKWDRISFRSDKSFVLSVLSGENVLYKREASRDAYFSAFLSGMIFQQSCYSCKFAAPERVGDITIGDFWGLDRKKIPQDYSGKVSVVLPNTTKGKVLMDSLSKELIMIKLPLEDALHPDQGNLLHPSVPHADRAKFLELMPRIGIKKAIMSTEVGERIIEQRKKERHKRLQKRKKYILLLPKHILIHLLGDNKYLALKKQAKRIAIWRR